MYNFSLAHLALHSFSLVSADKDLLRSQRWPIVNQWKANNCVAVKYRCPLAKTSKCRVQTLVRQYVRQSTVHRNEVDHDHGDVQCGLPLRGLGDRIRAAVVDVLETNFRKTPSSVHCALLSNPAQYMLTDAEVDMVDLKVRSNRLMWTLAKSIHIILYHILVFILQKIQHVITYERSKRRKSAAVTDIGNLVSMVERLGSVHDKKGLNETGYICCSKDNERFVAGLSTQKLLSRALDAQTSVTGPLLMADDTYRVMEDSMPVIIVGVPDLHQHFHLLGLFIATDVTTETYTIVFDAIVTAIGKMCGSGPWKMFKAGLSDGALAIRAAARRIFGDEFPWQDCMFHITFGESFPALH